MDGWRRGVVDYPGAAVGLHLAREPAGRGSSRSRMTPDQTNYLLRPQDALKISVWKEPGLTEQMGVRPDGKITYPLNRGGAGRLNDGKLCSSDPLPEINLAFSAIVRFYFIGSGV